VSVSLDGAKITILESRPLIGHVTLKNLAPTQNCLFVNKPMKEFGVVRFVEWNIAEPCIQSVNEDIY
jgi:hypothetical protein